MSTAAAKSGAPSADADEERATKEVLAGAGSSDDNMFLKSDILPGLVCLFAQVPASVAFAAMAYLPPTNGLNAAWMVGLPVALFGGRPGMIHGSAGAFSSVSQKFMNPDGTGLEDLCLSVIVCGTMLALAGLIGMGSLVKYVPTSVVSGFCCGLAITIGSAQLGWFQGLDSNAQLSLTEVHAAVALAIVFVIPFFSALIPVHFLALVFGTCLEWMVFRSGGASGTKTIGDYSAFSAADIVPELIWSSDKFDFSQVSGVSTIMHQGVTLAIVGALECLLTLELVNDLTKTPGEPNRHLLALGGGNILSGMFGTMGGTALIELSVMNCHAGGRGRLSSAIPPLGIGAILIFASPVLKLVPAGTLAGILIDAVIKTFKWEALVAMVAGCMPLSCCSCTKDIVPFSIVESIVFVVTSVVCYQVDIAAGILLGTFMTWCVLGLHADDEIEATGDPAKAPRRLSSKERRPSKLLMQTASTTAAPAEQSLSKA